jgi:uncharacterized SAM-binding protein YcdF (DUF218 family)
MDVVLWFGRSYLVPASPLFLVLGVLVALLLLGRERTQAAGRRLLWALFLLYLFCSTPYVSGLLARMLGGTARVDRAEVVRQADAIVLIGCGVLTAGDEAVPVHLPGVETAFNISEAVRLYRLAGGKRLVATGGMPPGGAGLVPEAEAMQQYLLRMGVAPGDIVLESASTNTLQQARNVAALLPRGARIVLVTVPTHMPRTAGFFRAQGFQVTEAVSALAEAEEAETTIGQFIPSRYALRASERAMYEVIGLAYYWLRGDFR